MAAFRVLGTALILIGAVLVIFGVAATQKTGEKIMGEVTGHYPNRTMWFIIGGIALAVGGFGLRKIK